MDRKSEFEKMVEKLVRDFQDLSYEEIADSLECFGVQYAGVAKIIDKYGQRRKVNESAR